MASQGPNFPTAATGNTNAIGGGSKTWTTPTNIEAADGLFTSCVMSTITQSDDLIGTNFGFSIPSDATINGILLEVNYKSNINASNSEAHVRLIKGGTAAGNDKSTSANIPTTATTVSYGGSSDLWGTSWVPSDINASNFGAATVYNGNGSGSSMQVDFFRITVFFTQPTLTGSISLGVTAGFADSSVENTSGSITLGVTAGFVTDAPSTSISLGLTAAFIPTSQLNGAPNNITLGLLANFQALITPNPPVIPIPPIPVIPPQVSLIKYSNLITSEHNQRPKFMAMIAAMTQPSVQLQNIMTSIPNAYDIDFAVGTQLDTVGQWVGVTRNLNQPITGVFFSWGVTGLGWGQGTWFSPFDTISGLIVLPDDSYRLLLRAVIAANQWDGTVPGAYKIFILVFSFEGLQVLIVDNQNMTMNIVILAQALDAVTLALIKSGAIVVRPAGVQIAGYQTAVQPVFGFGEETPLISGWGVGNWLQLVNV